MKKRLKTFQFEVVAGRNYLNTGPTNAEDMLCTVLRAQMVNISLKSRVRENRKHGSVGGVIV